MLSQEKQDIISSIIPKAVLKAVTTEAKQAIGHYREINDFVKIYSFPFNMGRETRTQLINGHLEVLERRKTAHSDPNNDIYLVDNCKLLQISREHFTIKSNAEGYFIFDRGSACGLMLGDRHVAGKDKGGIFPIKDGDVIGIGKSTTPYFFKFIVLKD